MHYRLRAKSGEYLPIFETGGSFRDPNTGKEMYLDGVILDRQGNSRGPAAAQAARDIAGATGEIMKTLKTLRLLALNARLEAVRAGDHGLGFRSSPAKWSISPRERRQRPRDRAPDRQLDDDGMLAASRRRAACARSPTAAESTRHLPRAHPRDRVCRGQRFWPGTQSTSPRSLRFR